MSQREHERAAEAFQRGGATDDAPRNGMLAALLRVELRELIDADRRNADGFLETPALGAGFRAADAVLKAAAEPEDDLRDPIGPYRLQSVLHDGDLAVVYLAEQREPVRRQAAIKVLRSRAARREVIRRFDVERRAIALMDHPAVARLYDAGTTPDGRAWFAMEYVPGEALTVFAERHKLPLRPRLGMFIRACLGVEHAHQRGVIHRDIKPSNVLAADGGDGEPVVKVIDFGVARAVRAGLGADATATADGRVVGTIAYMSPEQLAGDTRGVDTRTDVYALGALLYQLVAGRPAFQSDNPASVIRAVLHEPPEPIRGLPRSVSGDLRAIVERAMDKSADGRYPSVAELRADVERMLAGMPVVARRRRPFYLAAKFIRRNRVWTAAAAIAITGVAWGAWSAWSAKQEEHRLAMDLARAWFDRTLEMARSVSDRGRRRPMLAQLDADSQRLAGLAPRAPALLDMRADVLKARGDVELEEGWTREAGDFFVRALAIREDLAQRFPSDMNAALDYSIAMVRVGDSLNDEGRRDEAQAWYERALGVDEAIAKRFPSEPRAVTTLVWSMDRMAAAAGVRGKPEVQHARHVRQLALAERLNGLADGVDERRAVSVGHAHLAGWAIRERRLGDALEHAADAVAYGRGAVSLNPDNRYAQHTLISALMTRSSVYSAAGEPHAALADAVAAAHDAQRVADADPDEVNAAWQLVCALANAANHAEGSGNIPLAIDYARRRVDEATHLARLQPTNPGARETLASALEAARRLEQLSATRR